MNQTTPSLILASGSPRRRQLLEEAGLTFEISPAKVEENTDSKLSPEDNARSLALLKACWVAERRPDCYVLGADTLVALDNKLLGKPRDREEARLMLHQLSGNTHEVITGMALVTPKGETMTDAVISKVRFKTLSPEVIDAYLESDEPMDKAGAYAIQGEGAALIESHEGSYTNIVGLPVQHVLDLLQSGGYPADADHR